MAAGAVGFAIGSETLGSIVSPSIRCGTTGCRLGLALEACADVWRDRPAVGAG